MAFVWINLFSDLENIFLPQLANRPLLFYIRIFVELCHSTKMHSKKAAKKVQFNNDLRLELSSLSKKCAKYGIFIAGGFQCYVCRFFCYIVNWRFSSFDAMHKDN